MTLSVGMCADCQGHPTVRIYPDVGRIVTRSVLETHVVPEIESESGYLDHRTEADTEIFSFLASLRLHLTELRIIDLLDSQVE